MNLQRLLGCDSYRPRKLDYDTVIALRHAHLKRPRVQLDGTRSRS
jgi:hypothetical protein